MATIVQLVKEINSRDESNRGRYTDKDRSGFAAVYDELFLPYQETAKNVMELGVNLGGSCWVWERYFTNANVDGVDIWKRNRDLGYTDRFTFHHCDLGDERDLHRLTDVRKEWDIIIDDASHSWSHQMLAFEWLYPKLTVGGLYVIEDVETSYHEDRKEEPPCITFVEYVKNMIDGVVWSKTADEQPWPMTSITFRHNLIVVKK